MIEVRTASPADSRRIAEIQVCGWQAGYRDILPDRYLDRMKPENHVAMWEKFIRNEEGVMLVAGSDMEVLGFCHVIASRDEDGDGMAEIAAMYVDPECWRSGCGRSLYAAAIASAKERGFKGVTLWVLDENSRGRAFYKSMGMRHDGAAKSEEIPDGTLHEVRYRTELVS